MSDKENKELLAQLRAKYNERKDTQIKRDLMYGRRSEDSEVYQEDFVLPHTPNDQPHSGGILGIAKTLGDMGSRALGTVKEVVSEAATKAHATATKAAEDAKSAMPESTGSTKGDTSTGATGVGVDPDTPYEALNSVEGWLDNKLHGLRQSTYKARLFMTEDSPFEIDKMAEYSDLTDYIKNKKFTNVLQTGVTGLNISSMTIETIPSPNPKYRSMASNHIYMTVREPMGVGFLDMLATSAAELKIKNHAKVFFYLEVSFQGYDEEGNFELHPCASFANKGVWLYQLILIDIVSDFTAEGSTYELQFRPFEEQLLTGADLRMPFAVMPSGGTVGEMLASLGQSLNDAYALMYKDKTYKQFEFRVQKFTHDNKVVDPATFQIIASNETEYNSQRNWSLTSMGNSIKGHFPDTTLINDAVESILANSEAGQRLGKAVMTQSDLNDDKKDFKDSVIFRLVPTVEVLGYDFITESYKLKYILTVVAYFTQVPILSQVQLDVAKDPKAQARNVIALRQKGYLSKRYDYIFTGLSSDITSLEIKFKTNWVILLPRIEGFGNSSESLTTHAKALERSAISAAQGELADAQKRLARIEGSRHELNSIDSKLGSETTKESKKALQERKASEEAKLESILAGESYDDVKKKADELSAKLGNRVEEFNAKESTRFGNLSNNRRQDKYAEEVHEENRYIDRMSPLPITIIQDTEDSRFNTSGAFEDSYHRDRSIYGAMMDQLYSTQGGTLQNITMDIVGDPYWLGTDNLERSFKEAKAARPNAPLIKDNRVNPDLERPSFDDGDIMFLLKFKYPMGFDSDTNLPLFQDNEAFTGVYKVTKITHNFEGGLFKQTINATRMPLIQVFKAFGWRSEKEVAKAEAIKSINGTVKKLILK